MNKSNSPHAILYLEDAGKTHSAGKFLSETLYSYPITIFLNGDLGAGKTTFLQGFAERLGISEPVTSPTYALEQKYRTKTGMDFLHLDLYRLNELDAVKLVESTDHHTGIRCIEWAERLPERMDKSGTIELQFSEYESGRNLTVTFFDFPLPTLKQIDDWRAEAMLPAHITRHCIAVAEVAAMISDHLLKHGHIIRKDAVVAAAEVHDLFRFVDFHGIPPDGTSETQEELSIWGHWKKRYPEMRHEEACKRFLVGQGFPELGTIVETHGLTDTLPEFTTIEQKILFYADKRVMIDKVVSLDERFADFRRRYSNNKPTEKGMAWLEATKKVEEELFPEGSPIL